MFAGTGLVILVLPLTSAPRIRDTAEPGIVFLTFGGMVLLLVACARGVKNFRAWAWWLATGISALMVVVSLYGLLRPPADADPSQVRGVTIFLLAFHGIVLRYFLARRRDFGIGR